MRIRVALVLTLSLLAAVPAEAARDVVVRDSPRAAVATCLRPTATPGLVGLLGPIERRMSPYDLLRVSPDGVAVAATARLGTLDECPAVAADPSGHAIVAGAVRTRGLKGTIRAALAEPGGGFGAPVDIARTQTSFTEVVAAVSARGEAVLAWSLTRVARSRGPSEARTRVVAALRPAGGSFGRPQFLTPWRRGSFAPTAKLAAGMDASGNATVAWAQPISDRGNPVSVSRVAVATATPGGSFGPAQVLARRVQDVERAAMSVTPDGRALLAHDGKGTIWVYERGPGAPAFTGIHRLRSREFDWEDPDVSVAPDGSAVVAWRAGEAAGSEDVLALSRRGTGPWTGPVELQRSRDDSSLGEAYAIVIGAFGAPSPPEDSDNTDLRAAAGSDGRYVVTWGVARSLPFGDGPFGARMAHGQAGAAPARPETAGCRCRSVNGVVPLATAEGELLMAYTDNATSVSFFDIEVARSAGRLHVSEPGPPGPPAAPPRLTVRPPRARTLGYGNRLLVRAACDRPCDLRAYVLGGRGHARGMGTGSLARAGSTRLAIRPVGQHVATPSGRDARVVVHAYAKDGRTLVTRTVSVELRRKPVRPLPRLVDVRAVRQGRSVVVTWGTDRPARRIRFEVARQLSRRPVLPEVESLLGRGRRRFTVRLEGAADSVSVSVIRNRPPFDRRTHVVPVSR